MIRTLLFYNLELTEDNQLDLFSSKNLTLQNKVESFVNNHTDDELLYINKDDSVVIQLENISTDYVFGSYGRYENLDESSLTRGRHKKDFYLQDVEDLIESYTYFYLDLNTNQIVLLNNSRITGFKTNFSKFLMTHFRVSSIYKSITVENKLSEDIDDRIGSSNHFSSIQYTYRPDSLPPNAYASFKEMFGLNNNQIKTAKVHLILDSSQSFSDSAKILATADKSQFERLRIDTEEEVINAIEKTISKKVPITIDDDSLNELDAIERILADSLSN